MSLLDNIKTSKAPNNFLTDLKHPLPGSPSPARNPSTEEGQRSHVPESPPKYKRNLRVSAIRGSKSPGRQTKNKDPNRHSLQENKQQRKRSPVRSYVSARRNSGDSDTRILPMLHHSSKQLVKRTSYDDSETGNIASKAAAEFDRMSRAGPLPNVPDKYEQSSSYHSKTHHTQNKKRSKSVGSDTYYAAQQASMEFEFKTNKKHMTMDEAGNTSIQTHHSKAPKRESECSKPNFFESHNIASRAAADFAMDSKVADSTEHMVVQLRAGSHDSKKSEHMKNNQEAPRSNETPVLSVFDIRDDRKDAKTRVTKKQIAHEYSKLVCK